MKKREEQYDVIVIGGGASGLMAAGCAGARGLNVLLLEQNKKLGIKLGISGGGRCNITNAERDIHKLLKNYGEGEQYLYSPFSQFGVSDAFSFFEKLNLPLVVQARKRVFPKTEDALDVVEALRRHCVKNGVDIKTGTRVTEIHSDKDRITGVSSGKHLFTTKALIVATGGVSRPETGSRGDGFKWLKDLGHSVHQPTPTVVPLSVSEQWVKSLSGTSLSFMKISFYLDGKKQATKTGKILFTHFGISGPLILNVAGKVAGLLEAGVVTATIDAYPDTDHGSLDKKVVRVFNANKNRAFKNVLEEILPEGMTPGAQFLFPKFDFEKRVHSVTKEERKELVQTLKALPLTITGLMGFDRAVVADGGVSMSEIDTKTMCSKICENLYITGDLLHINRPTGGYSLQLSWTTGFVSGNSCLS